MLIHANVQSERGSIMFEALMAMMLIAVSLLGIAGLQASTLNNSGISRSRGLAAQQAESMAEAMGANEAYWAGANLDGSDSGYIPPAIVAVNGTKLDNDGQGLDNKGADCTGKSCAANDLAAFDLKQWGTALATLPEGNGQIDCSVKTRPYVCTVTVKWNETVIQKSKGTKVTRSLSMVTQP